MSKHGPTPTELRFRVAFSVCGLALVVVALAFRGLPATPGGWEAIALAVIFFGGTFVWSLRKLVRKDSSDPS